MRKTLFSLLLCCITTVVTAAPQSPGRTKEKSLPATIKVLLGRHIEGSLLEVKGAFAVYNPANGKKLSSGKHGKRFYIQAKKTGLKWGEEYPGIFQLRIIPTHQNTSFLLNGQQYKGALEIYHINDELSLINEVSVENYLTGMLQHENHDEKPETVRDSIAIVARTNAYYQAIVNSGCFYHVKASDVGYVGYGLANFNKKMERSINNTRHLIMTYDEKPFPSTWTGNCAGKTASYQAIFRLTATAPLGVESQFASKDRNDFKWSYILEKHELAKLAKVNRVTGVDLFVDHFSNKVYGLRVHDGNRFEDLSYFELQERLSDRQIPSNDFVVSLKGNAVIFEGYGEGCGAGLCLYSASQMSERGDLAPQILSQFFPYTHVQKMTQYPGYLISKPYEAFFPDEASDLNEPK